MGPLQELGRSEPGSKGNKGVLHINLSSRTWTFSQGEV